MAYIQKTSPPPNQIRTFSLRNFAGGINNRSNILKENEAHRLLNMSFAEDELMVKRDGQSYYNEDTYVDPIYSVEEYMPYKDANRLLVSTDSQLFVDGVPVQPVSDVINGVNFNGLYVFTDNQKLYAYGKFPQTSNTYTFILGEPDLDYTVLRIVNPPSDYVPLGTTHERGVTIYDYTNKQVWYEPCTLEREDTSNGFNVIPESVRFLAVYKGRLVASGNDKDDDNVFLTDVRNPFYFPVTLPLQLPPNSDKVVGLEVFDDAIVVGRKNDLYVIQGMTNNPTLGMPVFTLKKLNSHTGLASQKAMVVAHNYLFFLGSDGVAYALSNVNQNSQTLATVIISKQLDLFKAPFSWTKEQMEEAVSFFHDNEWFISIEDKVLIYNYRHQAWTYYSGLDACSFIRINGQLVWGNAHGRLCTFGSDYLDLGAPYEAYWTSKTFDMDDANAFKQFREFFIVAHTFNEYKSDVRVTFEVDYTDVQSDVVIQNQMSIWGKSIFGDRFITRNINASLPFVIGRRGRGIRFTFRNGYTSSTPVETYVELENYVGLKENTLVEVLEENTYYAYNDGMWRAMSSEDLNQVMKIYQVNGDYEYRGKR